MHTLKHRASGLMLVRSRSSRRRSLKPRARPSSFGTTCTATGSARSHSTDSSMGYGPHTGLLRGTTGPRGSLPRPRFAAGSLRFGSLSSRALTRAAILRSTMSISSPDRPLSQPRCRARHQAPCQLRYRRPCRRLLQRRCQPLGCARGRLNLRSCSARARAVRAMRPKPCASCREAQLSAATDVAQRMTSPPNAAVATTIHRPCRRPLHRKYRRLCRPKSQP